MEEKSKHKKGSFLWHLHNNTLDDYDRIVYNAKKVGIIRTLSEILVDADNATNIKKMKALSDELFNFKEHYELHEISYGLERIQDLALIIKGKYELDKLLEE